MIKSGKPDIDYVKFVIGESIVLGDRHTQGATRANFDIHWGGKNPYITVTNKMDRDEFGEPKEGQKEAWIVMVPMSQVRQIKLLQ